MIKDPPAKSSSLTDSLENLYRVFGRYPLKKRNDACPHCVGKNDNRSLHARPLRELSGKDLSFYGFKAIIWIVKDAAPFLETWLQDITKSKIQMLKFFVVDCSYGTANPFLADKPEQRAQIVRWLGSKNTIAVLENLFMTRQDALEDLSEILETIESNEITLRH